MNKPDIVFFDMDHTLLDNDCDLSWKDFLAEQGLADASERDEADRFWDLYNQGRLPVEKFLDFQLKQFVGKTSDEMRVLSDRHFESHVRACIFPQAQSEIVRYQKDGIPVAILTATNRVISEPVALALNIIHIIATELEMQNGVYTGRIVKPYCFEKDKVTHAEKFCRENGGSLFRAVYYGDSMSDVPMLRSVGKAVVVNPGKAL